MIHSTTLEAVLNTLTTEARSSLFSGTSQPEAVSRLEEIVRVTPSAVLFVDNSGLYVGANPAAVEITGYPKRELLRKWIWDLMPVEGERDAELLWRAFLRIGRQEGDIVLRRRDGSLVSTRYLAVTNLVPGVHVSVLARI